MNRPHIIGEYRCGWVEIGITHEGIKVQKRGRLFFVPCWRTVYVMTLADWDHAHNERRIRFAK